MNARLRVISGPHAGETFDVTRGKLLIGREEDCQLRPESEFVSRHHCVLLVDDYTLRVRDLGSKNGTFVNGRRITSGETILLHDDMLSIGEMICQVDLAQAAAALHGTGFFDGDTVQPQSGPTVSSDETTSLPVPLLPEIRPESESDTRTLHQAEN
jgi:pSer/pThr/pTyr-binding forkhead associated (FHA) protein